MLASRLALSLTGDCLEIPLFQDALIFSFEINLYIIVFFIYQINKIVTQSELDIKVGPGASPACVVLFFYASFWIYLHANVFFFWQNIENFKRWLHLLKNVVRVIHLNVTECPIFPLCLNSIFFAGFFFYLWLFFLSILKISFQRTRTRGRLTIDGIHFFKNFRVECKGFRSMIFGGLLPEDRTHTDPLQVETGNFFVLKC